MLNLPGVAEELNEDSLVGWDHSLSEQIGCGTDRPPGVLGSTRIRTRAQPDPQTRGFRRVGSIGAGSRICAGLAPLSGSRGSTEPFTTKDIKAIDSSLYRAYIYKNTSSTTPRSSLELMASSGTKGGSESAASPSDSSAESPSASAPAALSAPARPSKGTGSRKALGKTSCEY